MAIVPVFDHIPKTAGSTVRWVMYQVYGGEQVERITTLGQYHEDFTRISRRLESGPPVRAVISHAGAGLHERLPDRHEYPRFTILREPEQRTLSHYYYYVNSNRRRDPAFVAPSILEWLEDTDQPGYNAQTAFLSGIRIEMMLDGARPDRTRVDEHALERAKAELDAYVSVGFVEAFDASLLRISRGLGWPRRKTLYRVVNARPKSQDVAPLTDAEQEALRNVNLLDRALYDYAKARYWDDGRGVGAVSPLALRAFRAGSRIYGLADAAVGRPARAVLRSR